MLYYLYDTRLNSIGGGKLQQPRGKAITSKVHFAVDIKNMDFGL